MKILAFSPFDPAAISGNSTTLRRLQKGIAARGHAFEIAAVADATAPADVEARIAAFAPDLVHFYHAFRTGRFVAAAGARPTVVTLSGTDINECLKDPGCGPVVRTALGAATRLVTHSASIFDAAASLPEVGAKLRLLPKGVLLGTAPFEIRAAAGLEKKAFVFLHAGGIRPVKGNLDAIEGLEPVQRETPSVALVFAGPVLDAAYGERFARRLGGCPWVRHLPAIPFEAMAQAYRTSDVVLNTSISEGLSNTLMEAMTVGRPILAADIPGNRDLIRHGETGILFRGVSGLTAAARELRRDTMGRAAMAKIAASHAARTFGTGREIDALLDVYAQALSRA